MTDEARESMRALAGAVCPSCGAGFDEIQKYVDPDEPDLSRFAGGGPPRCEIFVRPCGCRISAEQYADVKRRLRS